MQACGAAHGPRDNAFRVRGKIETLAKPESCQMEVRRADTDQVMVKKNVDREFQETVGIAPGAQKIYVLISCPDSETVYKSSVYEVGRPDQYIHPIDLGVINLRTTNQ